MYDVRKVEWNNGKGLEYLQFDSVPQIFEACNVILETVEELNIGGTERIAYSARFIKSEIGGMHDKLEEFQQEVEGGNGQKSG